MRLHRTCIAVLAALGAMAAPSAAHLVATAPRGPVPATATTCPASRSARRRSASARAMARDAIASGGVRELVH